MNKKKIKKFLNRQQGAATLMMSLILLVAMSLISLTTARSALVEININANEVRAQQSFDAAEAGLQYAVAYLLNGGADQDNNLAIDTLAGQTFSSGNGSSYTVTLTDISSSSDLSKIRITATGLSDDATGERTLTQEVNLIKTITTIPDAALTSHGDVALTGTATVTNTLTSSTIWSGGNVTFGGASHTQTSSGSCSASCPDVSSNNATLSGMSDNQFFKNFFGATKAEVKANADLVVPGDPSDPTVVDNSFVNVSSAVDGASHYGQVIWIDGSAAINSGATVGIPSKPVILIIDGNAKFGGNATVNGVIYITNNWKHGNGTFEAVGATAVEGDYASSGTPDVKFDSTTLLNIDKMGTFAPLSGSWKDF